MQGIWPEYQRLSGVTWEKTSGVENDLRSCCFKQERHGSRDKYDRILPSPKIGISIRTPDTRCLISTCNIPANSLSNLLSCRLPARCAKQSTRPLATIPAQALSILCDHGSGRFGECFAQPFPQLLQRFSRCTMTGGLAESRPLSSWRHSCPQ